MSEGIAWVMDAASNFALHLSVLLAIVYLFFRLAGRKGLAWACLACACLGLGALLPSFERSVPVAPCAAPAERLRVVSFNLLFKNRRFEDVRRGLEALKPNVIVVEEANGTWPEQLTPLRERYPYRRGDAGWGAVLLFSDRPFVDSEEKFPGFPQRQQVSATVRVGAARVRIVGAHFIRPNSPELFARRGAELDALATAVQGSRVPTIVAGDFNASPLSLELHRFLAASGLVRPRPQGPLATWPSALPELGLQIDHILVTPELAVERLEAGPDLGSNHLPIVADIAAPVSGSCRAP
ncbi:MAG: endonuclease/exonuclease/phosphatase family protein [Alphaproteobacteria bacterium]|nr:endonuclease/exonuclease/phosphatase family protein [Alphaproteobacteria bacterium]